MPRPSRRSEVCATAARLFREYSYASATMDLIADEVGLNKGTLYHYYPGKSAILYELLSKQVDATLEFLDRVPAEGTITERTRELVRLQVDHVSSKHDEVVVFFQELPWVEKHLPPEQAADLRRRVRRYEHFTKQLLTAGVRSGEFRPIDVAMIMSSVVGILGYVPVWFRGATGKAQVTLVQELTDFVMNGIIAVPLAETSPPAPPKPARRSGAAAGGRRSRA
ncbi:TetR/AcrR family transcriptional regulator [Actinomadura napierensis]|uniref:TetR/AcrR family transcriptional regulator n=1 Tax=Actinomadura napierensis TaxID=267854 RepID=A0ABP5LKI4_9ACTN